MFNTRLPAEDSRITILRIVVALLPGIHGIYRGWTGGAKFFDEYLTESRLPLGTVIAWSITIFEILCMTALLSRRFIIPVALGFIFILLAGILMIHIKEGWFVVGGGRNGMEYSVLLISALIALIVSHRNALQHANQIIRS
jgi:putative oxidoreductase